MHSLIDGRAQVKWTGAAELMRFCSTDAGKDDVTGPVVDKLQKTANVFRVRWLDLGMPAQDDYSI